ncbi:MAG: chromate efflux transporter [Candidatus Diapherotrites archaeon]|nr:chromate efflux transporter [Candidatus Diapherotrites archaeon]
MDKFKGYLSLFKKFLRFGFLAWGGPVAQISLMHEELVEREKWVSEEKFRKVLALYQAMPGPEATELAVFFGYNKMGKIGGLLSGLGFVLPGFFLVLFLSYIYLNYGLQLEILQSFLYGVKAAIIALIAVAVYKIGKLALFNKKLLVTAMLGALGFVLLQVDLVLLLFGCAAAYYLTSTDLKKIFLRKANFFVFLAAPAVFSLGKQFEIFVFFLKAGLLTFGGAYTVIPFVQKGAINEFGWLTAEQFLDGLALSSVVPGPLIIVSTFVGFLAGGAMGAVVATFAVFLPAFAITLFGYNFIQKIVENKKLQVFLDGLSAAVVGLIAMSSLVLAKTALIDYFTITVFVVSLLALWKFKANIAVVIIGSGLAGLAVKTFFSVTI